MSPEAQHDDVLRHVEDGRRDFLKRVLGATTFAVPLMASFSMDGLSAAEAAPSMICGNQTVDSILASNMTDGHVRFKVRLTHGRRNVGIIRFELRSDCDGLIYTASLREPLLLFWGGGVHYPALRLRDGNGITVGLTAGKGYIQPGGLAGMSESAFTTLLVAMADGVATVDAVTLFGQASGQVVPD